MHLIFTLLFWYTSRYVYVLLWTSIDACVCFSEFTSCTNKENRLKCWTGWDISVKYSVYHDSRDAYQDGRRVPRDCEGCVPWLIHHRLSENPPLLVSASLSGGNGRGETGWVMNGDSDRFSARNSVKNLFTREWNSQEGGKVLVECVRSRVCANWGIEG